MASKYEIYLDESGGFEKPEKGANRDVCLIGGLVVPESLKLREDELRAQLIEIGKPYFPEMTLVTHIHMSDLDTTRQESLRKLLLDFFKDKMPGAFITFLYSRGDLEERHPAGPQFYRCMLIDLLKTLVHYHPYFEDNDMLQVMLAHRRATGYVAAMRDDLLGHGYHKLKDKFGKVDVTAITNADIITIMKLLKDSLRFNSNKVDSYRMNVVTGEKLDSYKMKSYTEWNSPFMAMADFICNTMYRTIWKISDPEKLDAEVNRLFNDRILFYSPSDYDFPFSLMSHFHCGSPDKFISDYLNLTKSRDVADQISDKYLLNTALVKLAGDLTEKIDTPVVYANIVALADEILTNSKFHRLGDVQKLMALVSAKLDTISDQKPDAVWDQIAFSYHDVSLRYLNHTSDIVNGLKHAHKALLVFKRLPGVREVKQLRKLHELLNRISVLFSNAFAFNMAIDVLNIIKEKEEAITVPFGSVRNEILGKVYGSLSQNYAFIEDQVQAYECMAKAEKHLGLQKMQISFRAHIAVDQKDSGTYMKNAANLLAIEAFPGYCNLIESLLATDLDENRFSFHLILKGLLTFPPEYNEDQKVKALLNKDSSLSLIWNQNGHPWQMIWIIMGRLQQRWYIQNSAKSFLQRAATFAQGAHQHTFTMRGHAARVWQALFELDKGNRVEAQKLLAAVKATFTELRETNRVIGTYNPNARPDDDGIVRAGWFDGVGNKLLNLREDAGVDELRSLCNEYVNRFAFTYW